MSTWAQTIVNFIYKMSDLRDQSLKNVLINDNLANLFVQIMFLNLESTKQIKECIISTTTFQKIDKLINELKVSCFGCYQKIINFIFDAPAGYNYNLSHFFNLLQTFLPSLIVSLNKFCTNTNFEIQTFSEVK